MLGQIQIPLADIPHEEHTFKWLPLGPHRRNLNPIGEICIDCWITEYNEVDTPTKKETHFFKFKQKFNMKQFTDLGRKGSIKYGGTSMKGSVSVEDLGAVTYRPTFSRTLERPKSSATGMKRTTSLFLRPEQSQSPISERSPSLTDLSPVAEKVSVPPQIKLIMPISGPSSGGTLIHITGKCLGENKRDIMALTVAGYDCLSTVEYISPNEILCTTPPGEGVGPVSLMTAAGGACTSKIEFQFEKLVDPGPLKREGNTEEAVVPNAKAANLLESKKQSTRGVPFGESSDLVPRLLVILKL